MRLQVFSGYTKGILMLSILEDSSPKKFLIQFEPIIDVFKTNKNFLLIMSHEIHKYLFIIKSILCNLIAVILCFMII